jgi:Big-like domain-containing protein
VRPLLCATALLLAAAPVAAAQAAPAPNLVRGVANSLNTVVVQFADPVNPSTVQTGDFILEMVEANRPVVGAAVSPDGTRVTLTSSSSWDPGTAGRVHLIAPGVVLDRNGVPNNSADWVTVGAAPGDFVAPVVTHFHLTKSRGLCWVFQQRRCPHPGAAWIYRVTEDGDAYITVHRGRKLIGVRRYNGQPGSNFINFDGKIGGRRLRRGLYTAQIGVQDDVGNRTPVARQPKTRFRVGKAHKKKHRGHRRRHR